MALEYYKSGKGSKLPKYSPKKQDDVYLPSEELQAAVNVALELGQPLLLTGDPGTGKTQLAFHVAKQFGLGTPFIFNAQTNSVKKDLFYHYDALGHFHYSQNPKNDDLTDEEMESRFIRYEALGDAIRLARLGKKERSVVLIDEIDKSPRDLPNDLLYAIEKLEFEVPEIPMTPKRKWECPPDLPPIIIITSNSEKNLPDAFLRRVVYHHIKFPNDQKLLEILQSKKTGITDETDLKRIIKHFSEIRELNLSKKPATAELISWVLLLVELQFPFTIFDDISKLDDKTRKKLKMSYAVIAKTRDDMQMVDDFLS